MKLTFKLTLAALLLIVISCAKTKIEPEKQIENSSNCLLTETNVITPNQSGVFKYNYDNSGRIIKATLIAPGEDAEFNYTYSNNQIIEQENSRGEIKTSIYKLDASGKIISSTSSRNTLYKSDDRKFEYFYNSDGYIIETKETNFYNSFFEKEKYSYLNGNLTIISYSSGTSTGFTNESDYITISYNSDLSSNQPYLFYIENDFPSFYLHVLKSYFGKQSKNLASSISRSDFSAAYVYEKDKKGNISKVSMSSDYGDAFVSTHKYTCN